MDVILTREQELLRDGTARFISTTFPLSHVRAMADGGPRPGPDYTRQAGELGWFAMLVPTEFGGGNVSGAGVSDAALIAEEHGRGLQPGPFVPMNVAAFALAEAGSDLQRAELLPRLGRR